ncbi:hypothetical protein MASR2M44_11750 [Bacteroidota bacterium]
MICYTTLQIKKLDFLRLLPIICKKPKALKLLRLNAWVILFKVMLLGYSLQAQQITQVSARQDGKKIVVEYEATGISAEQFYNISLAYSTDGINWVETQKGLSGVIGKGQQLKSSNQVIWEPLQELPALTSSTLRFQINAKASFENVTCYGCTEEQKWVVQEIEANMVSIPAGSFWMGCSEGDNECYDDEKRIHQVRLNGFKMSKYEVTQVQWEAIMGTNPSNFQGCSNCPVEQVSWNEAQKFIKKLNSLTRKNYRLPTEAEWEYAARGGEQNDKYSGSDDIGAVAWYYAYDNSGSKTHPVGQKQANGYGLKDMSGNVWEWCNDWYGDYSSNSQNNPQGPSTGANRVYRGGSCYTYARSCRVSNRSSNSPDYRYGNLGFRLAR